MIVRWLNRGGLLRLRDRILGSYTTYAALLMAGLIAAAALYMSGCGASGIQTQARAARVTAATLSVASDTVDAARTAALDRAEEEHPTDPEHDEAVREADSQWRPVRAAVRAARDALLTWTSSLRLAHLAGDDLDWSDSLPLIARVALLYEDIVELTEALGVDLPALPSIVTSVAQSYAGGR